MRHSEQEVKASLSRLHTHWEAGKALEEYARKFSAAQRQELAKKGWALSDGSYPIETEADLGPAITLASSGHGDVAAAKALIKRRAKELGAANRIPSEWAAADNHDSSMMKAISDAVDMQQKSPDLATDANDSAVLSHLHAARSAQQRDMAGHAAAGY